MRSLSDFVFLHVVSSDTQRLGQRFVNRYIKVEDDWSKKLFDEEDEAVAKSMIQQWLIDNQYMMGLPPRVTR